MLARCDQLKVIGSGLYADRFGGEYFYLTGVYALMVKDLVEKPGLNNAAFVVNVLDELRQELSSRYYIELMD